jgi:hypothetical protein
MNAQDSDEGSTVRDVEPDYQAWEEIDVAPKFAIVETFRYLGRRTIFEVLAIVSLAGLIYLGGKIIVGGEGLSPTQGYRCLLVITLMIFATPILHYYLTTEGRRDGKIEQRTQDPPEPGDE